MSTERLLKHCGLYVMVEQDNSTYIKIKNVYIVNWKQKNSISFNQMSVWLLIAGGLFFKFCKTSVLIVLKLIETDFIYLPSI